MATLVERLLDAPQRTKGRGQMARRHVGVEVLVDAMRTRRSQRRSPACPRHHFPQLQCTRDEHDSVRPGQPAHHLMATPPDVVPEVAGQADDQGIVQHLDGISLNLPSDLPVDLEERSNRPRPLPLTARIRHDIIEARRKASGEAGRQTPPGWPARAIRAGAPFGDAPGTSFSAPHLESRRATARSWLAPGTVLPDPH